MKIKRALISVSDKTGLMGLARGLRALGVEIISTGGTAKTLRDGGVPVVEVSDYTGFPEILDGRVKTLQPAIHGGLLALRDNPEHMAQLKKHEVGLIDMVVVNLYPFERVTKKKGVALEEALKNIDIGGPSMLRSAAKNFKSVAVVCNPQRYRSVLDELDVNSGILSDAFLMRLSVEAFEHTSKYDGKIYSFLKSRTEGGDFYAMPKEISFPFTKVQDLRYGENPHQAAAFYRSSDDVQGLAKIKQLHGKELSFNNFLDLDAAMTVIKDFDQPAAVVIKHNNPTGVAEDRTLAKAYKQAWSCDPLSAFGGIVGLNKKVDLETAQNIIKSGFMECIIAPGYAREAKKFLSQKKNLRIIQLNLKDFKKSKYDFKEVAGGLLLQDRDNKEAQPQAWRVVTQKKPTTAQMESLEFGWKVVKHIRSNAIVLVKGRKTVGIGCGQTSRVESVMIAIKKAGKNARNSFLISDAFLPKTDNVEAAAKAGIKMIVQTGGSIADQDVIKAADKAGIVMVMTGARHFKH
ncbi:MAG: bifunctional phosphoribosylaminoimidazolecarboxamide formyltransferase/IMP cyclohydrolase [Candidatus Omnitrophica bacterium]|nr:bifunctional phosphoribosylaminoimidazolecarboxamide formyltransferase/IMP cyclohydrolase [Candidatus Omnitrophota bacterium]